MYRKAKIYKYPVNNVQQFLRKGLVAEHQLASNYRVSEGATQILAIALEPVVFS